MEMRSPGETDLQNSAQQAGVSDSRRRRRPVGAGGGWCRVLRQVAHRWVALREATLECSLHLCYP